MDKKYLDANQEFIDYHVASNDGTFNGVIRIQKVLVDEIKEIVDYLKENIADGYVDASLNTFIVLSLINGVEYMNSNNNLERLVGDSYGN